MRFIDNEYTDRIISEGHKEVVYRRMMRIPWTAKITNVEVRNEIKTQRKLIINIRKRPSSFFGHVMRRGSLEHTVITGKIEGR